MATLLPFVMPFAFWAAGLGWALLGIPPPEWFSGIALLAGLGIFFVWPAYVVVIGVILGLIRRRSWRAHALAVLAAPLLMIPTVGAVQTIFYFDANVWTGMRRYAPYCLKLGYGYVVLAFVGLVLFQRLGWIREAA